jgi:hypothetical protein
VFYTAVGIIIRKAHAFPRWLGWVSWVLAVVALVPPVAFFAFIATPIWVLIVCVLLLRLPARTIDEAAPVDVRVAAGVPARV